MSAPRFSVVIPSFNRRRTLERVLDGYRHQVPESPSFEVIVVDDGSTDGTAELLAGRRPNRYRLRHAGQDNGGPALARNHALELARGEIVLFTGDDVEPTPNLLVEHHRGHRLRASPRAIILGLTRWPPAASLTATMRHIDGVGAQQFSYHFLADGAELDFRHFYTSNVSIRRSLLDREPGYFATDFPAAAFEDAELAYRLSLHGGRIFYHAAAVAHHHHHYTVRGFFRRQERCGEMAMVLYRKLPQLEKWLGLEELTWLRLAALHQDPDRRRLASRVAANLEGWERRLLDLASFFDPLSARPLDDLYLQVFRYGYFRGLAHASLEPPAARRACAALYLDAVPPAASAFAKEMARLRLPCPRADPQAIAELASTP